MAFPRFYFVSSADLLDILSKGAQPKQVINFLKSRRILCYLSNVTVSLSLSNATYDVTHARSYIPYAIKIFNAAAEGCQRQC